MPDCDSSTESPPEAPPPLSSSTIGTQGAASHGTHVTQATQGAAQSVQPHPPPQTAQTTTLPWTNSPFLPRGGGGGGGGGASSDPPSVPPSPPSSTSSAPPSGSPPSRGNSNNRIARPQQPSTVYTERSHPAHLTSLMQHSGVSEDGSTASLMQDSLPDSVVIDDDNVRHIFFAHEVIERQRLELDEARARLSLPVFRLPEGLFTWMSSIDITQRKTLHLPDTPATTTATSLCAVGDADSTRETYQVVPSEQMNAPAATARLVYHAADPPSRYIAPDPPVTETGTELEVEVETEVRTVPDTAPLLPTPSAWSSPHSSPHRYGAYVDRTSVSPMPLRVDNTEFEEALVRRRIEDEWQETRANLFSVALLWAWRAGSCALAGHQSHQSNHSSHQASATPPRPPPSPQYTPSLERTPQEESETPTRRRSASPVVNDPFLFQHVASTTAVSAVRGGRRNVRQHGCHGSYGELQHKGWLYLSTGGGEGVWVRRYFALLNGQLFFGRGVADVAPRLLLKTASLLAVEHDDRLKSEHLSGALSIAPGGGRTHGFLVIVPPSDKFSSVPSSASGGGGGSGPNTRTIRFAAPTAAARSAWTSALREGMRDPHPFLSTSPPRARP